MPQMVRGPADVRASLDPLCEARAMHPQDDKPRPHHYEFAHRVMPSIALNPDVDLAALAADGRLDRALHATWAKVGEGHAETDRVSGDGLGSSLVDVNGLQAVVLSFPTPMHMAEVFSAVVAPLEPPTARRYFTLEFSWDFAINQPDTVLCEWSSDGHTNYGAGPAGTDETGLLRRVGELLG
jgi:hypothetical protein